MVQLFRFLACKLPLFYPSRRASRVNPTVCDLAFGSTGCIGSGSSVSLAFAARRGRGAPPHKKRLPSAKMGSRHRVMANPVADGVPRKRIAVVGSGVAGLSAAYLLSRRHEVHIFEREDAVGMDAHSVSIHGARMDIPLRVFSESYYPNLCNIYKLVGVNYDLADYSFSCRGGGESSAAAYFRYVNCFVRGMSADSSLPKSNAAGQMRAAGLQCAHRSSPALQRPQKTFPEPRSGIISPRLCC